MCWQVVPSWESEPVVMPALGGALPSSVQEPREGGGLALAPGWEACQGGATKGWGEGRWVPASICRSGLGCV